MEPGNAYVAGVDLPGLLRDIGSGAPLPDDPIVAKPGVRTRSTMAIALGAADRQRSRRAVLSSITASWTGSTPLGCTTEMLTPVSRDLPSLIPFVYAIGTVLTQPERVDKLARDTISDYGINTRAINTVRSTPTEHVSAGNSR